MYNIFELNEKSLDDLKIIATEMGIDDENRDRTQLIYDIIDHQVDHPDIKKTAKPKKQKTKAPKAEKAEPKETSPTEKSEPVEVKKEPVREPAEENAPKGKRGKRPRISKEAEANVNEWQKNNAVQLAQTPVPNKERVEAPVAPVAEEPAVKPIAAEETVEVKPIREKKENQKQKRKRIHETPEEGTPSPEAPKVHEEVKPQPNDGAPTLDETPAQPKQERPERERFE